MAKAIQNVTVTVNTAPLKKAIEEIVDAKLKSIGQEVLGEVTSVIESILSDRKARILKVDKSDLQLEERRSVSGQKVTKEMCKRGSHPGRHSARCLEAASK